MKGEKWTTEQIMRAAYLRIEEKMTWPEIKAKMDEEGFPEKAQIIMVRLLESILKIIIYLLRLRVKQTIGEKTLLQEDSADILLP